MRTLFLSALAVAIPAVAFAQTPYTDQLRLGELQAQQDLARQRAIAQDNELTALTARIQTETVIRDLAAQRVLPKLPTLPDDPNRPPVVIDTSQLPSIPDDRLAASNAAVRAASEPRR